MGRDEHDFRVKQEIEESDRGEHGSRVERIIEEPDRCPIAGFRVCRISFKFQKLGN